MQPVHRTVIPFQSRESLRERESLPPSDETALTSLIRRTEEQAKAFNAGRMEHWFSLLQLADDFTLMQPFGGPATHGFDASPQRLAQMSALFRNGNARLEVAQTYVSDDMVVLVFIERQHLEVHGMPLQDWSLRVTQVYRRHGADWQLVHRHADPLVHELSVRQTAALARGAAR
ncbi:YybH family protein [Paracidovorax citrulli]